MKVAFLDSGVGGLTVLKQAISQMPDLDYIYYGDCDNAPYGTKDKSAIHELVLKAVDFLADQKIDALVLACNTATSVSISQLRAMYDFPIIGMEPAVKLAAKISPNKKILVTATDLTLKEKKLEKLLDNLENKELVELLSLQQLVIFAEKYDFSSKQVKKYITEQFKNINWEQYSSLVLGCTHYIYYKTVISELVPENIQIVDGNQGTINNLRSQINYSENPETKTGSRTFYVSGKENSEYFNKLL
jgi:glutamate racemase